MTDRPSTQRLSPATIVHCARKVTTPAYDRTRLAPGIVHLGLGAFYRAHGAAYTEDVLTTEAGEWGIVGVSLQRSDQRDRLAPQAGLYTLLERAGGPPSARIVGAVCDVLWAGDGVGRILDRMSAPATRIVSLTITEKGYCHDPATGRLRLDHPDVRRDLTRPDQPVTAMGLIVAALDRRRTEGLAPFTVLCCDNLPSNGRLVAGLIQDHAAARSDALAQWISTNVAFPSTMVDRIVPAATDTDIADAQAATGLYDAAPVSHEPFRQWVIEDCFVDGRRPAWERAGAELVTDVAPYEHMKLMLLNGSHSALAYLGYLGGHETIGDCVADDPYRRFVEALWRDEILPVVPPPPGVDLAAYTRALLSRYANPAIRHRTWQIAMDGSQKIPQRLLSTVRARLSRHQTIERLALVIAGWIVYVGGVDEAGRPIDVRDPRLDEIRAALDGAGHEPAARVAAIVGLRGIFGTDLGSDTRFVRAVTSAYARLVDGGARRAVSQAG